MPANFHFQSHDAVKNAGTIMVREIKKNGDFQQIAIEMIALASLLYNYA
jgi:hypothetical protein